MQCALSGVVPTEPVLSLKSGHVFEKRLIHKHVEQLGTDPVTNQEMSLNDLVEVKTAKIVRPRPPSATSVPGILQIFQNEWDALMLETHTLKQQLHAARQELTQSLYRNDAANRVIARLIQERDQARAALAAHGMPTGASADGAAPMDSEMGAEVAAGSGIPESAVNKMTEAANALSKPRKKRVKTLVEEVTAAEKVQGFKMGHSHPLHSTSKPGILSLDLHSQREHLSVTGGADGNAIVFNLSSGKIEDTLKAHTARVNAVKFHPTAEVVFTASADNSAIVWGRSEGKYGPLHTLQHHTGEVVGLSVHPCGDYFVTASADSSWNFYDTASGVLFKSVSDEKQSGYTSVSFHPDGLILGCGTKDGFVRIFDVKSQSVAASFSEGHSGAIRSLAFSENGYYFASADDSGQIKLWDLRKLANFKTLSGAASAAVASLAFDESGSYLAAGSSDIRVFETKNWDILSTLGDHKAEVTALKFTKKAAGLVSVSKDRNLKVYSA